MSLRTTTRLALSMLALLLAPSPGRSAARAAPPSARASLQAAVESDLRARARYLAYAARADEEGYRGVARVFRAGARSEEIRARGHAEALRHLGGAPATPAEAAAAIPVGPTRQNLLATLAYENAERLGAYPRLVRLARSAGEPAAVLTFTLAHGAEAGLVRLYQDALANLERLRAPGEPLLVCAVCGHVERAGAPERCPVCLAEATAFAPVT